MSVFVSVLTLVCAFAPVERPQDDGKASGPEESAARYLQSVVDSLQARRLGDKPHEIAVQPAPLMKYNDPARGYLGAGVWRLGDTGRPVGLVLFEYWGRTAGTRVSLTYELVAFPPHVVEIRSKAEPVVLRADGSAVQFATLLDAPQPAVSDRQRLAQMRSLARRFSSSERGSGSTYILRLVPQPIDRYQDEKNDILDGAAFVFAYGTNPELVVLIECNQNEWRYAAMRLSSAEVVVEIDHREVVRFPELTAYVRSGAYSNGGHAIKEK